MMTVSCVYCRRTYAEKDGDGVSHGICDLCHNIVNEDFRQGGNCNPEDIRRIADFRLPACQRGQGL